MRKFFKSLAVLLALTLIVGVIPAAAADSLSMQKEKILYLGGSQGTKEDGTKCKTGAKKLVANMIKGFDKDTMSVDLKSADDSIVKASNKTGKITAKSLGTTTVTVTVFDAAETQILKQDLKVKVKKNASDVTVTGIADGDKVSVGQTVDVTLPRAGVDTDERELTVDNTEIAEIKLGEKNRTYTVKFLKAGEATFTAKAYQSAKYPAATQSKTIKVTVGNPVPTKAEAIAANAIELTFDEDVEAFGLFKDAKEIPYDAIYYLANETTKVNINAVKAVKATANKVKIDLFGTLLDNVQYFVELNGAKLDFVLANIGPKDVATVEIKTARATKDNATKIEYILRNKAGIDITASALEKGGSVSITQVDYNADIRGTGNANEYEIVMWTAGAVANLKAKYSFFDGNDNYKEYTAEATGTITCVDESPLVFKKTVFTLNTTGAVASTETNLKHHFSLNEKNTYKLAVALVFTKDGKDQPDLTFGSNYDGGQIKAWIPDNNKAIFTTDFFNDGFYTIDGNSEGTATVFVGYTKNGADKVIDVLNVEVRGDKKASRIELKLKNDQKTLNVKSGSDDKITFVANVFDQYNEPIDIAGGSIALTQVEASKSYGTISTGLDLSTNPVGTGKYELEVNFNKFSGVKTDGSSASLGFYVKNTYNGAEVTSNNVYFNVAQKNALSGNVAFTVDNASLDTSVFDKASKVTEDKAATLRISRNDGGFFTGAVTGSVSATGVNSHTATQAAVGFQLEVLKNGTLIDITTGDYPTFINPTIGTNGSIVVKGIVPAGSGEIKKLATGTYTFRLFEYKMNTANTFAVVQNPQVVTVTVGDKQVAPVFKQVSEKTASGTGSDCFTFTFDGKNIHDLSSVSRTIDYSDSNASTSNVYVKSAKVRILVNLKSENPTGAANFPYTDYWYDVKVTIGTSLKK